MSGARWRRSAHVPYDFGKPFDNRRPAKLSILQWHVLEGNKSFDGASDAFMLNIILWALEKNKGNVAATARQLGMLRTTINHMMAKMSSDNISK